jgi:hypothetical protein
MTTIEAKVPDYLAALAQEAAVKEKTTLDQIVAVASEGRKFRTSILECRNLRVC